MLTLVFLWTCLIPVSFITGLGVLNITNANCFERTGDRFIVSSWLGISLLAIAFLGVSLVFPLSPIVGLSTTITLLLASLAVQKTRYELWIYITHFPIRWILGFSTLAFGISTLSTQQVGVADTGLYHYQVIKWLSEVGTVPGLALIHERFGYYSSWFALHAPFDIGILENRVGTLWGGVAFLLLLIHFLINLTHIASGSKKVYDWLIVISPFFYLSFIIRTGLLLSPSPDVTTAILPIVIGWSILIISEQIKSSEKTGEKYFLETELQNEREKSLFWSSLLNPSCIPLILSAGLMTMKLSGAPMLLISFCFYVSFARMSWKYIVSGGLISFVLIFPVLLFGTLATGCPLYPSSLMCLDLPWSLGGELAKSMSQTIQSFARWGGGTPEGATNWNWIGHWISIERDTSFLIFISLCSTVITVLLPKTLRRVGQTWTLAIGLLGISFMLYGAPTYRFGVGYLCIIPSLLLSLIAAYRPTLSISMLLLFSWLLNFMIGSSRYFSSFVIISLITCVSCVSLFNKENKPLGISFILAISLYLTNIFFHNSRIFSQYPHTHQVPFIWPPGIEALIGEDLIQMEAGNFSYFVPSDERPHLCWATSLICSPYVLSDSIYLRDKALGIRGGFEKRSNEF